MPNAIFQQRDRGWVKQCCKKGHRKSSLLSLSPNREAIAGASYLIPSQDLLKGMEREQLASGIRKKRHSYRQRTYPLHLPSLFQKHGLEMADLVTLTYNIINNPLPAVTVQGNLIYNN